MSNANPGVPGSDYKILYGSPDNLLIILTAVFVYLLVFKLPGTPIFTESDPLIFAYESGRLLQGDVMYRDFFEFTFPGTQALYASIFFLFGQKYWILPAVIVGIGVSYAALLLTISKRIIIGPFAYMPALIFIFFGYRWFGLDGTHRMLSPIFILLAIWVLLREQNLWHLAASGIFCALASFFTQQRGIAAFIAISTFVCLDAFFGHRKFKRTIQSVVIFGFSFVISVMFLCGYFVEKAGIQNFWYATFFYPATYYAAAESNGPAVFYVDLTKALDVTNVQDGIAAAASLLFAIVLPATILAALIVFARRRGESWESIRRPILVTLIGTALLLTTFGPNPTRLYQVSPPLLIVFSWLLSRWTFINKYERTLVLAASGILIALAFAQDLRTQFFWNYKVQQTPVGQIAFQSGEVADKYSWLAAHTTAGDLIFEARQPYVYFPLQLRNPTRMGQIWPSDYTRPEQVQQVILDLKNNPPRFILWDTSYSKSAESRPAGDHLAPIYEFLTKEYDRSGLVWTSPNGYSVEAWEIKPNTLNN